MFKSAKSNERKRQRILRQIDLLEHMDRKLWWQSCAVVVILSIAFSVGVYGLITWNMRFIKYGFLSLIGLLVFFSFMGTSLISWTKDTDISHYSGATLLYAIYGVVCLVIGLFIALLLGLIFGDAAPTPDFPDLDMKPADKPKTREDVVALALAKRRALLERL